MFKEQVEKALASLTQAEIDGFNPNDEPPKVHKGDPLIIGVLDDEWKKRFALYRTSKGKIEVVEAAPIVELIQGLEVPVTQFFADVKEGQPGGWTSRSLHEKVNELLNEGLQPLIQGIEPPEPDEFDVHVNGTFWDELRAHLEETGIKLPRGVCPLSHLNIGVVSGWQVAVTGHKSVEEMMMGPGGPLEFLSGFSGGVEVIELR